MKLTQANIDRIALAPGQAERIVFDERLPGFGLRLRAGGKRTWIVQYRTGTKQRRKTLGSVDKIKAAKAYSVADRDLAAVTLDGDPQAKKIEQRARAAETFEPIGARFLRFKEGDVKPSSYAQIKLHMTEHWAPFNRRSVHDIARRDVAVELGKIAEERGAYAANRARATLSGFFGWTMSEGIIETNPVIGAGQKATEKARDRVLADAELVAIWKGCKDDDYGRIVRLLILTAQRREEVGGVRRSEIADRIWSIPAARTKNGLPHEIPLSDAARAILRDAMAREDREDREAIFGEGPSDAGFSGWSKAKSALDERIEEATNKKPTPWRVHDIRRTVATRMADLGVLPHVIEAALNHISGHKAGVAGVYNRALYSAEKRQALDLWAAHVEALLAGKPASNVVALKA
jgi:integrase